MPTIKWRHTDDDDVEHEVALPGRWKICPTCNGDGKHSRHLGAITEEDRERDWSQDEWEGYVAGSYDTGCEECRGTGKVAVIDEPECKSQGREDDLADYNEHLRDEAEWAREERVTAYWESGGAMGSRY